MSIYIHIHSIYHKIVIYQYVTFYIKMYIKCICVFICTFIVICTISRMNYGEYRKCGTQHVWESLHW